MEQLKELLKSYQAEAKSVYEKKYQYPDFGYANNNINCLLGLQYEMAMVVTCSENAHSEMLDFHLGNSMFYLACYCNNNNLSLGDICGLGPGYCYDYTANKQLLFETYLELHRKEVTLELDMIDDNKKDFVMLMFQGIFEPKTPLQYIQHILSSNIKFSKK